MYLQGLLALEGELTPILVQMVKSANMNGLLDSDSDSLTDCQQRVKARLHEIMQKDQEFTQEDYQKVCVKYLFKNDLTLFNKTNEAIILFPNKFEEVKLLNVIFLDFIRICFLYVKAISKVFHVMFTGR